MTVPILPDTVEDRYHTVREVASIFKVEPATVRLWIKNGELAAIKVGKAWRITRQAMAIRANNMV